MEDDVVTDVCRACADLSPCVVPIIIIGAGGFVVADGGVVEDEKFIGAGTGNRTGGESAIVDQSGVVQRNAHRSGEADVVVLRNRRLCAQGDTEL